jgi:glycosyltransferase involved in cell wall biosynthesis
MLTNSEVTPAVNQPGEYRAPARQAPLRVAIISDFLEEQWPSMNLVADMLTECLRNQPAEGVTPTQVRPAMRWRLTRAPLIGTKRTALNGDRLWNRFIDYPRALRSRAQDFELFHIVDHSYSQLIHSLAADRTVVTCHDLDTFRSVLEPEREPRPRWFQALTRKILSGFRQAAHVMAVSQATRDELLHYGLVSADRVSVVPNGVHPSCSPLPNAQADALADGFMPEATQDAACLLSVGSTLARKRLDVMLRVFARVRRELPQTRLVRVGGFTPAQDELIRELNIGEAIVSLPFLERDVLAAVYRRATLLMLTAEAEGFGLPVIEAMACGCPVGASDIPVLREVGGPAAVFCPLGNIEAWSETLIELLKERLKQPGHWQQRSQAGIEWTRRFTWAENARQTAGIYRKVMGNNK